MSFIKSIFQKNGNITLKKFSGELKVVPEIDLFSGNGKVVCFLDVETTGKNRQDDGIVEIALKSVLVNEQTGEIQSVKDQYESLNDPGIPVSDEASAVNGITNDMVSGKKINWGAVEKIVNASELIVSHNASFDRAFLDRALPISNQKLWACSINDIDWFSRGFTNFKQELLCIWHGFYYESHRAMSDVDALIYLLTHNSYSENKPLSQLIENSETTYFKISALKSPFETKDKLKSRNYNWDSQNRCWWKKISADDVDPEKQWLAQEIYSGYFQGKVEEISLINKYKD